MVVLRCPRLCSFYFCIHLLPVDFSQWLPQLAWPCFLGEVVVWVVVLESAVQPCLGASAHSAAYGCVRIRHCLLFRRIFGLAHICWSCHPILARPCCVCGARASIFAFSSYPPCQNILVRGCPSGLILFFCGWCFQECCLWTGCADLFGGRSPHRLLWFRSFPLLSPLSSLPLCSFQSSSFLPSLRSSPLVSGGVPGG